ncbi:MAG: N-acetylornithine carbamoyltransferase [Alphaproteobacteria bacterium]
MSLRHVTSLRHLPTGLPVELAERAIALKDGADTDLLEDALMIGLFLNPSLRTRMSFETAMMRFGGQFSALSAGGDMWQLATGNAPMKGDAAEHIEEAIGVLSRYADVIGLRTFAGLKKWAVDLEDTVIKSAVAVAERPVISMESAMDHPCQGLADLMTLREEFGPNPAGKNFVLTWTPHVKQLPMAVPNAAVQAAALAGMNVTVACPSGYDLPENVMNWVAETAEANGNSVEVTDDQVEACVNADVVYAKSWTPMRYYGRKGGATADFKRFSDWTVTEDILGDETRFMHCLPIRRGVVAETEVIRGDRSLIFDQAENRMWAQTALLEWVLDGEEEDED